MRSGFKKKIILYVVIGLGSIFVVNNVKISEGNFGLFRTSSIAVFEPVDLGIEKVTLKKIADKYSANIVITNYGGDLKNGQLVLQAGDEEKHVYLKNDDRGFSLAKGKSYIVENYELLFGGDYNGGKLSVEIKLPEKVDYFAGNNKYDVDVFTLPAKIEALGIDEIEDDGTIKLAFEAKNHSTITDDFEIYKTAALNFDENESRYAEAASESGDKIFGYYRIKNSEDLIKNNNWSQIQSVGTDPHFIKLASDPFKDPAAHYLYIKAINKETGNYVVSNIISLVPGKDLTRAAFAKFFVEYGEVKIDDDVKNNFADVAEDEWYAPYVKTLSKLDLIKDDQSEFHPEKMMTRGEAFRMVKDYFEVGEDKAFDKNLQPEKPATKNYLKYLIYEYKKNS
ncbi:S-layer homology domain-containing protein [Candidatus Peregrinibacteria bacterium]|nr:S-layer homology domain-containing protein [Candidatus Peregrinibacteria bacterium]